MKGAFSPPRPRRALLWAIAVAAPAPLAALAGGCGSASSPSATADAQAQAVCPDTLADTIGAGCGVERLVCSPRYACGTASATARCECTSGTFVCTDPSGAALAAPDATPACPPPVAPAKCPVSELAARLAACTEPGLICTYLAPCDATPAFDQCQCASGPMPNGQTGLRFGCYGACTYEGTPVEVDAATVPDSAFDADAGTSDEPNEARTPEASEASE